MARSLVLNATYEPLCVVPTKRALVLVLDDKAELVHVTGRVLHSERLSLEEPSVVRLSRFVRVPYQRRRSPNRRTVLARDDHACQYCGAAAESVDHVVPRSRGGEHSWENVVAACRRCNAGKRDRLLHETTMRLCRQPAVPPLATWLLVHERVLPPGWSEYVQPALERSA